MEALLRKPRTSPTARQRRCVPRAERMRHPPIKVGPKRPTFHMKEEPGAHLSDHCPDQGPRGSSATPRLCDALPGPCKRGLLSRGGRGPHTCQRSLLTQQLLPPSLSLHAHLCTSNHIPDFSVCLLGLFFHLVSNSLDNQVPEAHRQAPLSNSFSLAQVSSGENAASTEQTTQVLAHR